MHNQRTPKLPRSPVCACARGAGCTRVCAAVAAMAKAKKASVVVRLMSQAGTGYYYIMRRSLKGVQEKCVQPGVPAGSPPQTLSPRVALRRLELIKFDPIVNARVLFKEERIKK